VYYKNDGLWEVLSKNVIEDRGKLTPQVPRPFFYQKPFKTTILI